MKRLLTILLTLVLVAALVLPVQAATQEADLEYIDTQKDVVFWVSWDVETPDIIFLAPDGTEYNPMAEAENTTTILNDKDLYYVILDAPAGQWRVRYDKGNNTTLDISVHDYEAGITIETFTIGQVDGDRLPVQFRVGGKDGQRYQYRISAMIDHTGMEKELATGSGTVGNDVENRVSLKTLSTYSGYLLKLYVWYDDNGTDIFDFAFSDRFSYTNTSVDQKAEDFALTVIPGEQILIVSWPDISWKVESVLVAVFEDGASEPAVFDEYSPKETDSVQLAYDPAAKQVDVEFTVKIDGVNAAPTRKTLFPEDFGLSLPDGDAINTLVMPLAYSGFSKQLVNVTVNGYNTELVLDGDGSVNITLGDDWNTLLVEFTDADNITWQIQRNLFVDRIPPILTMSRTYDGMQVDGSSIIISGTALDCEAVTINGQAVPLSSDGGFSQEITLTDGSNTITVIASDGLGNESQYTAVIYSGRTAQPETPAESDQEVPGSLLETLTGQGSYWVLLIVSILCLLVIGYALIFWRKEDKK